MKKEFKDTNPKDRVGVKKVPMSAVPAPVIMEVALAMLEGDCKYAKHNYRVAGVRASVYYDAAMRHLTEYWEGEAIDKDSGLSNITKAIASLVVLRDAEINSMVNDDRPPAVPKGWLQELNKKAAEIIEKYPERPAPYTQKGQEEKELCEYKFGNHIDGMDVVV